MASISGARVAPIAPPIRSKIPILDQYILREFVGPFGFALLAYLLFWFINIFFLAADYIINAHAPFLVVLRFLVFRIPQSTPQAFPFAALFGTMLAMGRLAGDNELNALRTSGISLWRICRTPVLLGSVIFLLSYFINERVTPASVDLSTRTFYQIVYHQSALPIEPQLFRKDPDTQTVFYVTQVASDYKTMEGVMIFRPNRSNYFQEVVTAKKAHIEGGALVLENAVRSKYNAEGIADQQYIAKTFSIGLPLAETAAQFVSSVNSDPYATNSKGLAAQVKALQAQGVGGPALGAMRINLANKLAYPAAALIGVIIALPLAIRFGSKGRTLGITLSIMTFFVYYVMTAIASAIGRNGAINPYLAAWLPNVVMGGTGLFLLWHEDR
ncbi:MAG: LptF/LptG family permease [Candidatus Eremiobacteraeota bacterium]|nr:LptF/LptG family permease [Candidatus Eremiobacteraeota bacterium]